MTYEELLKNVSDSAGILSGFHDIGGTYYQTDDETRKMILSSMGIDASTSESLQSCIDDQSEKNVINILEPVYVFFKNENIIFRIHDSRLCADECILILEDEKGIVYEYSFFYCDGKGSPVEKEAADCISADFDSTSIGYYGMRIVSGKSRDVLASSRLILCPEHCYLLPNESQKKYKGLSLQLYAVDSKENFGVGDFNDLFSLMKWSSEKGLLILGINPVHSLFPSNPGHYSPYSPSSRIFGNSMYISLKNAEDWSDDFELKYQSFLEEINSSKNEGRIHYRLIGNAKNKMLGELFDQFYEKEYLMNSKRAEDFNRFVQSGNDFLERQSVFDALFEYFMTEKNIYDFRHWPEGYQNSESTEVQEFKRKNKKRILYFKYIQWIFFKQLGDVSSRGSSLGVSLYLDLAVGCVPGGAEVWSFPEIYGKDISIGAPPDPFAPDGQNWGLSPLIPQKLKETAYEPFIRILRGSMQKNGFIRIDHAMGLLRLYWTSHGKGAYVAYPFHDLIGILCLESSRTRCSVIGEDLGTVPDGFREELEKRNILIWKVMYFQKNQDGSFIQPQEYPFFSVATVNTHDLPTVCGYLRMDDILKRYRMGILSEEKKDHTILERKKDISELYRLAGLDIENADVPNCSEIVNSLNQKLSCAGSSVILYSLYDLLYDYDQPNLPGTVDEYPNWSIRYKKDLANIFSDGELNVFIKKLS